jgi:hypothetical protein
MNQDQEASRLFQRFGKSWPSEQDIPAIKDAIYDGHFAVADILLKRYFSKTTNFARLIEAANLDFAYNFSPYRLHMAAASTLTGSFCLVVADRFNQCQVVHRFSCD